MNEEKTIALENQVCTLEEAKAYKAQGLKLKPEFYWVNLSAWKEGYKVMPAEEAEFSSAETKYIAFTDFSDTYPAYTHTQLADVKPPLNPE